MFASKKRNLPQNSIDSLIGVGTRIEGNVVFKGGLRVTTTDGYLEPARGRANLEIRGGALVDRVLFEGNRATGVRVRFEGVGRHPHWRSPADNERFAAAVAAGVYNWVEVATPGFELHSRADYFAETMSDPRWSTPAALSADSMIASAPS